MRVALSGTFLCFASQRFSNRGNVRRDGSQSRLRSRAFPVLSPRPIVPHAKGIQDGSPGVRGSLPSATTNAGESPNLWWVPLTPSLSPRVALACQCVFSLVLAARHCRRGLPSTRRQARNLRAGGKIAAVAARESLARGRRHSVLAPTALAIFGRKNRSEKHGQARGTEWLPVPPAHLQGDGCGQQPSSAPPGQARWWPVNNGPGKRTSRHESPGGKDFSPGSVGQTTPVPPARRDLVSSATTLVKRLSWTKSRRISSRHTPCAVQSGTRRVPTTWKCDSNCFDVP
jgi:hypothetical protein